ncbi:hypothetical protein [Ectothiorhodospira variabilis]|nr:hypothetical protein [Ectothiorhodospira variabilis]
MNLIAGATVTVLLINWWLLSYLFFFSGWWRNRIILPLHRRIRRD